MYRVRTVSLVTALLCLLLLGLSCARQEAPPPETATTESPVGESEAPIDSTEAESETSSMRPAPTGQPAEPEKPVAEAKQVTPQPTRPAQPEPAKAPPRDPNVFVVRFETTKGNVDLECHRDWAPLGADRFRELVEAGFYDGARFFRVVPGFVVQFGIAANPLITQKWEKSEFPDDPVLQSNKRGTLSFATAGPNTRTTQVFINLNDNERLDGMGFAPFARVLRGMDAVDSIDSRYGEQPRQPSIEDEGEAYLQANFPNLDKITRAFVLE